MSRIAHVLRELIAGIAHTASAALNTVAFGGDMFTSTSARAHMEQDTPTWATRRRIINAMFLWEDDHCRAAFEADLDRAMKRVEAHMKRGRE